MPGPWEKYQQQSATTPPWEKYAQTAPADVTVDPPATASKPPQRGFLGSAADSSGLSMLGNAIMHPIKTANNVLDAGAMSLGLQKDTGQNPILNGLQTGIVDPLKRMVGAHSLKEAAQNVPLVSPILAQAQAQHDAGNNAGMAGTLAGAVGGAVLPRAVNAIPPALRSMGEAGQDSGVGLMNKTIGTLKPDFRRGANPARGYFEAGGGPALNMNGLATKGAELQESVGGEIPKVLASNTAKIPVAKVAATLARPYQKAMDLETGPGGMGNTDPIERYQDSFSPALNKGSASGGMTPLEVWDMKKRIAQNTNWSDPTQFNLKAVRQQQAGGLSGVLGEAVPKVAPLNQQYKDLVKFAARAGSRAETGSSPLTSLAFKGALGSAGALSGMGHGAPGIALGALLGTAMDSVPVRSTLASGLYYGGKLAGSAANALPSPNLTRIAVPAYSLQAASANRKKRENED